MTDVTGDRTLAALMDHWAGTRPSAPALVHHGGTLSWERLATDVTDLRGRLARAGVRDQERVVVALPTCPLVVALWIAVPANGAVVAPVDPDPGVLALSRTLAATAPVLVVATEANAAAVGEALRTSGVNARLVVAGDDDLQGTRLDGIGPATAPPDATAGTVAALLPTSGTSAAPKLVELTHRNLVSAAERQARNSGFTADDRHYLCTPFFGRVPCGRSTTA